MNGQNTGKDFEKRVFAFFKERGIDVAEQPEIAIAFEGKEQKSHKFDFKNENILVECKANKWTKGDNVPSAKLTNWDVAMLCFYLAPKGYKKYFFAKKYYNQKKSRTLLQYYCTTHCNLIPTDVILVDYDVKTESCTVYTYDKTSQKHTGNKEFVF